MAQGDLAQVTSLLTGVMEAARAEEDAEALVKALMGLARVHIRGGAAPAATALLDEAAQITRRGDMRMLSAEVLCVRSELQAALGNLVQSAADWDESKRLFTMLHSPQARIQPAWLT